MSLNANGFCACVPRQHGHAPPHLSALAARSTCWQQEHGFAPLAACSACWQPEHGVAPLAACSACWQPEHGVAPLAACSACWQQQHSFAPLAACSACWQQEHGFAPLAACSACLQHADLHAYPSQTTRQVPYHRQFAAGTLVALTCACTWLCRTWAAAQAVHASPCVRTTHT